MLYQAASRGLVVKTLENYIRRLEKLEEISESYEGVKNHLQFKQEWSSYL